MRPDGVTYRATNVQSNDPFLGLTKATWVITTVTDRNNNRLTYRPTSVTVNGQPEVRLATIEHSRAPNKTTVSFGWEAGTGRLTSITSLPGQASPDPAVGGADRSWERRTELTYTNGRLTKAVLNAQNATVAAGRRETVYGYDTAGTLTSVTDGRGNTSDLAYTTSSGSKRATTFEDRADKATAYAYGAPDATTGELTTTATNPVGAKTAYTISGRKAVAPTDARIAGGNIVRIRDDGANAGPSTRNFAWHENWLVSKDDGANNTTNLYYNDLGLLTKVVAPAPNDPSRADITTQPKTAIESTLAYELRQPVAGCTEPQPTHPNVAKAGYCHAVADMTRSVEAANVAGQARATDFAYDPQGRGNLTSMTRRGATTSTDRITTFAYYPSGALCSIDGPRTDVNDVTRYGDDATTVAACASAPTYGGYDPTGQPTTIVDAAGKAKRFQYLPYGPAAVVTDRQSRTTKTVYDNRNNPTRITDPAGRVTTAAFDALDQRTATVSARGNVDGADPDRYTTSYTYDRDGRLLKTSSPGAVGTNAAERVETSTAYFDDGTKRSETNAAGGVTTYEYHPNRALKAVVAPAGTGGPAARTDYDYDLAGRQTRVVLPATSADGTVRPARTTTYTPQGKPSVETETSAVDGQNKVTRHAYNAHGDKVQTAGPRAQSGEDARTEWDYNPFGERSAERRRLVGRWLTSTTDYDAAGNKIRTTQPTGNGATLESLYRYNALNQLAAQTKDPTNPDHEVGYTYDGEGAQLTRTDWRQTAGPAGSACGDPGVNCAAERTTTTAYNADGTTQSTVSADKTGRTLATCNWTNPADKIAGYDADRRPLVTRTLSGTQGCDGPAGDMIRRLDMTYDDRGFMKTMTQAVQSPETGQLETREQAWTYRNDGVATSATHNGQATTYTYSLGGYLEGARDWRNQQTTITNTPSGAPSTENFGNGAANSTRTYTPNGMLRRLQWTGRNGTNLRTHANIAYDLGDQRLGEDVTVTQPAEAVGADTQGRATWGYDLADRLTNYTSPYTERPLDATEPATAYTLDDGGNITRQTTTVAGVQRRDETSSYNAGQLRTRQTTSAGLLLPATSDIAFGYTPLGEEATRTTTSALGTESQNTAYGPAGHTATVDRTGATPVAPSDIDYRYDGNDRMITRQERPATGTPTTTVYFYWGNTTVLAEETDGQGDTLARYLTDGADDTWGQQTYRRGADQQRDPNDTAGTWAWLLDDTNGNTATHAADDGSVVEQAAFDPYGRPELAGKGAQQGSRGSTLGYQSVATDRATGTSSLGARLYDPTVGQFTTPDQFVASALEMAIATDTLTGNRYLFAAANPVSYYEDGHFPCWKNKAGGCRGGGTRKWILRNATVSGSACVIVCWGVTLQNGTLSYAKGGIGLGVSAGPGWNSTVPAKQQADTAFACVAGIIGLCGYFGEKVPTRPYARRSGYWGGFSFVGSAGFIFSGGNMRTYRSVQVAPAA
mgnify:CR=1 FL=1